MGLKELLGEELHKQVMEKLGDRTIAIVTGDGADGSWIPKKKFDDEHTEVTTLKGQLADRDKQLDDLSKQVKDSEELTKTIEDLKEKNRLADEEHAAALRQKAIDFAVQTALTGAHAHDPKAVVPFLNMEKISVDKDGKVTGIDDQLTSLVKEKSFLFGEAPDPTKDPNYVGQRSAEDGKGAAGKNPWAAGQINLTEQTRIYKEDPKLAKTLMEQAKA